MTFAEFNTLDATTAREALLRCCGSPRWVDAVLGQRPFQNSEALFATAESLWWNLDPKDWLEAFSEHPRIGQNTGSRWSSQEQSGVASAARAVLERFAEANKEYEQRFDWIFLVNATGKTAQEMLGLLEARLTNTAAEELHIAAGEQAKITRLRLHKLFDE